MKHLGFWIFWFGTRGSEVQILSPRPSFFNILQNEVMRVYKEDLHFAGRPLPRGKLPCLTLRLESRGAINTATFSFSSEKGDEFRQKIAEFPPRGREITGNSVEIRVGAAPILDQMALGARMQKIIREEQRFYRGEVSPKREL